MVEELMSPESTVVNIFAQIMTKLPDFDEALSAILQQNVGGNWSTENWYLAIDCQKLDSYFYTLKQNWI